VRRRLTIAMVAVTFGALLVAGVVTLALTVHTTRSQTEHELTGEAYTLAQSLHAEASNRPAARLDRLLATLRKPLRLDGSVLVAVRPDGTLAPPFGRGPRPALPSGLHPARLDLAAVAGGQPVSGIDGNTAYAIQPFLLRYVRNGFFVDTEEAVVLARQTPTGLGTAVPWLLIGSGAVLAVAALVADRLGRRLVRPLHQVESVTARIAGGDLSARVDQAAIRDPELRSLGTSIDAMAAALEASQGGQRQFLLSVSHELRTPLTSIQGFAEALEDGTASDVRRAAAVIAAEARRLGRLVSDLLQLARLEAGTFSSEPARVLLPAAVEVAVMAFEPAALDLGLVLDAEVGPAAGVEVWADADRLTQVVSNLVENALNHATTRVAVWAGLDRGVATIRITDDGPGIGEDELPHIFTRLFTGAATGRRVGTGLGLAIVAELVRSMGGQVWAESPVGPAGGTCMVVTLAS